MGFPRGNLCLKSAIEQGGSFEKILSRLLTLSRLLERPVWPGNRIN